MTSTSTSTPLPAPASGGTVGQAADDSLAHDGLSDHAGGAGVAGGVGLSAAAPAASAPATSAATSKKPADPPPGQALHPELALAQLNSALEQRTAELQQLRQALMQSQKLEALGQFTAGVAHDFNNFLGIISGCIELLKRQDISPEQRSRNTDRIFETVQRAAKLTAHLVAFSRQESLQPEVFDVGLRVQGMADLLGPLMGVLVHIDLADCHADSCRAVADVSQFETALVNLAANARDAMDARGLLTIRVQPSTTGPAGAGPAGRPQAFVAVSVADTGCGIPAERLKSIFETFYTTKEVGKGTGLGLSQVQAFVAQSGGHVEVESTVGHGSVFTLYLPSAQLPSCSAPEPEPEPGG